MKYDVITKIGVPGGYTYIQEETGWKTNSKNYSRLVDDVIAHRKSNNLPIPFNIYDIIAANVCRNNPAACVENKTKHNPAKKITFDSALKFTRTLFSAAGERVDQKEADSRAEICASCEDNVEAEGCNGCKMSAVDKLMNFVIGNRETTYDKSLKSCKYCGCFNRAQIWFPLDALRKGVTAEENDQLPKHCWKKA